MGKRRKGLGRSVGNREIGLGTEWEGLSEICGKFSNKLKGKMVGMEWEASGKEVRKEMGRE